MKVPGSLMDTIEKANMLHGIDLKDAPKKNPDGSYNMNMTPKQFKQFQDNQQNPPPPKPSRPTINQEQPSAPDDGNISVTKDPSMSSIV